MSTFLIKYNFGVPKKVLFLHKQKVRPEKCGFVIKLRPENVDNIEDDGRKV